MDDVAFTCPPVDLPDEAVARVLERLSTEDAAMAFRMRRQSLPALSLFAGEAKRAIEDALELLTTR